MYTLTAGLVAFSLFAGVGAYLLNYGDGEFNPFSSNSASATTPTTNPTSPPVIVDGVEICPVAADLACRGLTLEEAVWAVELMNSQGLSEQDAVALVVAERPTPDYPTRERDERVLAPSYEDDSYVVASTYCLEYANEHEGGEYKLFKIDDSPVFDTGGIKTVYERLSHVILSPYAIGFAFETLEDQFTRIDDAIKVMNSDFVMFLGDSDVEYLANPTNSGIFHLNYVYGVTERGTTHLEYTGDESLYVSMLTNSTREETDILSATAVMVGGVRFELG